MTGNERWRVGGEEGSAPLVVQCPPSLPTTDYISLRLITPYPTFPTPPLSPYPTSPTPPLSPDLTWETASLLHCTTRATVESLLAASFSALSSLLTLA